MVADLPATFVMVILGVSTFILVMFLPALLELKNPKDAGPRRITEEVSIWKVETNLASMEKDVKVDQALIKKISEVIAVLPNLEL
jgi:hypothetical protein